MDPQLREVAKSQGIKIMKLRDGMVIAVAGFKGGSGKSTTALCLAVHWHRQDRGQVALVDGDPQGSIATWRQGGKPIDGLAVTADSSDKIGTTITNLRTVYNPVVVDTAGFRNRTTIAALGAADIAIIPIKPSTLDLQPALETYRLIEQINQTAERQGRPITIRLLLTMTHPKTAVARHMRQQIVANGLPLLEAELVNRVAYTEASISGLTPTISEPRGAAAKEIAAVAAEIDTVMPQLGEAITLRSC